jgi:hypothetical protein
LVQGPALAVLAFEPDAAAPIVTALRLGKRLSPAADAEFREVAKLILAELREIAPSTFQDFTDEGLPMLAPMTGPEANVLPSWWPTPPADAPQWTPTRWAGPTGRVVPCAGRPRSPRATRTSTTSSRSR